MAGSTGPFGTDGETGWEGRWRRYSSKEERPGVRDAWG